MSSSSLTCSSFTRLYVIVWTNVVVHLLLTTVTSEVVQRDYCETETFNVSCMTSTSPHHVLLIRHALYGRMKLGRCVLHDYGYVGCHADVTSHLETLCSGNVSCQVHIPDAGLDKANQCPRDLKTYLQVSYECVPVRVAECSSNCDSTSASGHTNGPVFQLGHLTDWSWCQGQGHGLSLCPVVIRVDKGQRIDVFLWEISGESAGDEQMHSKTTYALQHRRDHVDADNCTSRYALIRDAHAPVSSSRDVAVCGGGGGNNPSLKSKRTRHIYTSFGNLLHVYLVAMTTNSVVVGSAATTRKFLLEYKPVGCPDVVQISMMTSYRREEDVFTFRCANSDVIHHLVCSRGTNQWRGDLAACTSTESLEIAAVNVSRSIAESAFLVRPPEILLVVTIAVAVVIGSTVIAAGFVALKRCNSQQTTNAKACRRSFPMNTLVDENNPIENACSSISSSKSPASHKPRYALAMYHSLRSANGETVADFDVARHAAVSTLPPTLDIEQVARHAAVSTLPPTLDIEQPTPSSKCFSYFDSPTNSGTVISQHVNNTDYIPSIKMCQHASKNQLATRCVMCHRHIRPHSICNSNSNCCSTTADQLVYHYTAAPTVTVVTTDSTNSQAVPDSTDTLNQLQQSVADS